MLNKSHENVNIIYNNKLIFDLEMRLWMSLVIIRLNHLEGF